MQQLGHGGVDGAGGDGIGGDAVFGQLHRHLAREGNDGTLRGAIGGATGAHGPHAGDRGNINNATPAVLHHQARRMLAAKQGAGDIDLHGALEFIERKIKKRKHLGDAGTIDQNIAAAMGLGDLRKARCNGVAITNIHGDGTRLQALCL